jgi:hypothetical protein
LIAEKAETVRLALFSVAATPAVGGEALVRAVTDELLAHGEFSSAGNNYPNAKIAAKAVIDIVIAAQQASPLLAVGVEPVARAHISLHDDGPYAELEVLNGELLQPSMSPVNLYAAQPASPLRGRDELARKAALFREGARRQYEGIKGDMWFFDLYHFLGDVEDAAASHPEQPATPAVGGEREALVDACMRLQSFMDTFGDIGGCETQADLNDWLAASQPASPLPAVGEWSLAIEEAARCVDIHAQEMRNCSLTLTPDGLSAIAKAIRAFAASPPEQRANNGGCQ